MNADEQPMTYAGLVKAAMERPPLSQCLLFAGGVEERPYFRQFQADMEKHGGVVFDASGPPMPLLVTDRTGKIVKIPVTVERRAMSDDEALAVRCIRAQVACEKARCEKGACQ